MFTLGTIGPLFGDIQISDSPGLGKIAVSDADGNLSWTDEIVGQSWKSASSGARIEIFPDSNTGIIVYDDDGNQVFKVNVGGADVGDVYIGDYAGNQGAKWNKVLGSFTVRGSLNASDLRAGTITGRHITTSGVAGAKVEIFPDGNTGIIAYDVASDVVFKVMLAGGDAGDVEIGHYSSGKGMKWDSGTGTFFIIGAAIKTSLSTARLEIFPDASTGMVVYDDTGDIAFKVFVSGVEVGDVLIGDYVGGNGMKWDKSAGVFYVRGDLFADDIRSGGTITGSTFQTASSGDRIVVDSVNNRLSVFDAAGEVVRLDDDFTGVSTNPGILIGGASGGYLRVSKNKVAFGEPTPDDYGVLGHNYANIHNTDASTTALYFGYRNGSVSAIFAAEYDGAGNGVFFQGQKAGSPAKVLITMRKYGVAGLIELANESGDTLVQLVDTSANGKVWARDGFECNLGVGINEFSTDGAMAGNSDSAVPTEQAVVEYMAAHVLAYH